MNGAPLPTEAGPDAGDAALQASLAEIARDALLDQLERGSARHALRLLLAALGRRLGDPVAVQRTGHDGRMRWQEGDLHALGAAAQIDIEHLGLTVGRLFLAEPLLGIRRQLEPILPTVALLMVRGDEPAGSAGAPLVSSPEVIGAALASAGTFVWQWDIQNDWLSDIHTGLSMLGHKLVSCEGLTQQDWNQLIHPEDLDANDEAYQRHARGEIEVYEHLYRVRAADGSWRWMQERGRIVERDTDGQPRRMVGTQTDVSERMALQREAAAALQLLRRVAAHAPGVLYQFERAPDGRTRFTYISERVAEIFGISPAQAMHDTAALFDVIEPEDRAAFTASLEASRLALAEWRHEFRVRRPGPPGPLRWVLGTATPQAEADGRTVWSGYLQDITVHRELEQARQAAVVADAANRAKTQFLSRMSHELRTPLNAVLGFAQLMEIDGTEPPGPLQQRRLKLVREAGEHLLHMISDMLDLTRIEAGGMTLTAEPVPLRALAEQVLALLQEAATRAQVQLVLEPGPEVAARADRTRVRQVLLNLVGNAIKYNRPGGQVELSVRAAGSRRALVGIADTGVGIAEADLPFVFEPFQRGRQAQGPIEGAGIGLAVTRALAQLMGGSVHVSSTPGIGSVFTLGLPLMPGTAGAGSDAADNAAAPGQSST